MNITYDMLYTHFNVPAMPDYEGISQRFLEDFQRFITRKKRQAAYAIIREECPQPNGLSDHPAFVQAVADRIQDEAILEKRFIFISVNIHAPTCYNGSNKTEPA